MEHEDIKVTIQALLVGGPRDGTRVTNEVPAPVGLQYPERRGRDGYYFGNHGDPWKDSELEPPSSYEIDQVHGNVSYIDATSRPSGKMMNVRHHHYRLRGYLYVYVGWTRS